MNNVKRYKIIRMRQGFSSEKLDDYVIEEYLLNIEVNGKYYGAIPCIAQNLDELVIGKLLCDGLICEYADIGKLAIEKKTGYAAVTLTREQLVDEPDVLPVNQKISSFDMIRAVQFFLQNSELFQMTGAVHASALWEQNVARPLYFREDINRRNAIYKVLGAALKEKVSIHNAFLLTSGRVQEDIMRMAIFARVPMLITRSAPTTAAIDLAREKNITLCGFARGTRINIYSAEDRIIGI